MVTQESNVYCLYIARKKSGRLQDIEGMVNLAILELENYVKESIKHFLLERKWEIEEGAKKGFLWRENVAWSVSSAS